MIRLLLLRRAPSAGRWPIPAIIHKMDKGTGPALLVAGKRSRFRYFSRCSSSSSRDGSGEDPDEYRGPGGLTATEIFKKVQESAGRDKAYSESIMDDLQREFHAAEETKEREEMRNSPDNMSVRELREALDAHSVDHSDCFEKSDLIQRARDVLEESK